MKFDEWVTMECPWGQTGLEAYMKLLEGLLVWGSIGTSACGTGTPTAVLAIVYEVKMLRKQPHNLGTELRLTQSYRGSVV